MVVVTTGVMVKYGSERTRPRFAFKGKLMLISARDIQPGLR